MAYSGEPGEGGVIKTSGFKNFDEFFPYYMNEHKNLTCRRLHGARLRWMAVGTRTEEKGAAHARGAWAVEPCGSP